MKGKFMKHKKPALMKGEAIVHIELPDFLFDHPMPTSIQPVRFHFLSTFL